jgi:hypothetical protein
MRNHVLRAASPKGGVASDWSPADITTNLWLDASDASTLTVSAGVVDEWRDKAGVGPSATQTGSARPEYASNLLNGLAGVRFTSRNKWMSFASQGTIPSTGGSSNFDVFIVYVPQSGTQAAFSESAGILKAILNSGETSCWIAGVSSGNRCTFVDFTFGPSGSGAITTPADATTNGSASVLHYGYAGSGATAADRVSLAIDATLQSESTGNTYGGWGIATELGRSYPGDIYTISGDIFEIVIASDLATDNKDKISGYLAHKWGLDANLPTLHPYKLTPP